MQSDRWIKKGFGRDQEERSYGRRYFLWGRGFCFECRTRIWSWICHGFAFDIGSNVPLIFTLFFFFLDFVMRSKIYMSICFGHSIKEIEIPMSTDRFRIEKCQWVLRWQIILAPKIKRKTHLISLCFPIVGILGIALSLSLLNWWNIKSKLLI